MEKVTDQSNEAENEDRCLRFIDLDFKNWIRMRIKARFEGAVLMRHGCISADVHGARDVHFRASCRHGIGWGCEG